MAFLPGGNFLVTESIGTMRIVTPDGVVSAPLAGVPGVKVVAAQGLHDVVLDPGFAQNRLLYFCYFAPPNGENRPYGRMSSTISGSGRNHSQNADHVDRSGTVGSRPAQPGQ